jgi:predicted Zn-ribbon and HTH transcriptional regulator
VQEKWLMGWSDDEIANHLQTRTAKAVAGKRSDLKLLPIFHPKRSKIQRPGTRYTHNDEIDILRRFEAKEPLVSIAASYHTNIIAIEIKITQLRNRAIRQSNMTERRCLGCGNQFVSSLPKSVNRRCPNCHATLIAEGASFLTAY